MLIKLNLNRKKKKEVISLGNQDILVKYSFNLSFKWLQNYQHLLCLLVGKQCRLLLIPVFKSKWYHVLSGALGRLLSLSQSPISQSAMRMKCHKARAVPGIW